MSKRQVGKFWPSVLIAVVLFSGAYYYPLPYYVSMPGDAVELAPIISVENRFPEEGTFMLTTVRMGGANVFNYSLAKWDSYKDIIPKEEILAHYEDEEEYTQRQLHVMKASQESAILVAYRLANKPVEVYNDGIMVVQTVENMPGRVHFDFGDMITHVDGTSIETSEELITYLQDKQVGDSVEITYLRGEKENTVNVHLVDLPLTEQEKAENAPPRAGIGISLVTQRRVKEDPPVEINTERIGGPSAGLMFTLEIYNQLTKEDITKGHRIAGTGTINADGVVGRIGGIHQKIVAADKAKAAFFFAPHVKGVEGSNYDVAVRAAEDIGTNMKVIPVETVQDALDYLASIPVKEKNK
jgi:PDZ domain-containing protein